MSDIILRIRNLSVRFGGIVAISSLDLSVARGTVHAVIGPNGAGKSTLINAISGVHSRVEGSIELDGEPTAGMPPWRLCQKGLARTFQNTELYGDMTLLGNVMCGMHRRLDYTPLAATLRTPRFRRIEAEGRERAMELLDLVGLAGQAADYPNNLPFASQRKLELARALAAQPRFLLLDEPAAGLRAGEIDTQRELLTRLASQMNLTVLLIDHVMSLVMKISDRITVLNFGRKIAEGTPEAVAADPVVHEAYLGKPKEPNVALGH